MNVKEGCTVAATVALVMVVAAMTIMFVMAIIDPTVDDKLVFDIVGPAFQTIVGGFIGLITGIKVGEGSDK
jgi:multisubunit Na+/H+ antiporter MnhF subunit